MASPKTITINGRRYDAVTGLPIKNTETLSKATPKPTNATIKHSSSSTKSAPSQPKPPVSHSKPVRGPLKPVSATGVHSTLQRSATLAMRVAKKPVTSVHKIVRRPQTGRAMDIASKQPVLKNRTIRDFAPDPVVRPLHSAVKPVDIAPEPVNRLKKATKHPVKADRPPQTHPAALRAMTRARLKKQALLKASQPKTNKQVKEAEIAKALEAPKPKTKAKKASKNPWVRRLVIVGGILLVILGAMYAVYRFIPSVSVGIAASQAGVDAKYPDYVPDGFSFHQPVTYTDGEVGLTFESNSNDTSYVLSQKRSSWDSSAVLDNVVVPIAGDNYTITKERGLIIYTYNNGAAWVNGGILYVITGNTVLSNDQIRHIATSL